MNDEKFMQLAIDLAKKGRGWTNPNPMVGAVIVKNGVIIGQGYHHRCGELHAERDAFKNLSEDAAGATIYVTLEPCCHTGKQPPCVEAIVENKIAKVVIGSRDPNPLVSGKGVSFLREHGIEVIEDFMRDECDRINPIFFHFITSGKPYVTMKYAMTVDGKIATSTGDSKWITGEFARKNVHEARVGHSAILAGIGTVLADDPMLNVRLDDINAHQPVRIIADSRLQIPLESQIVKSASEYRTIIACARLTDKAPVLEEKGLELFCCDNGKGQVDFKKLFDWLGQQKIDSVFVEGGGQIHEAIMKTGYVSHVMAYLGPKIFGGSDAKTPVEGEGFEKVSEALQLKLTDITKLGEDVLLEYDPVKGGTACLQE